MREIICTVKRSRGSKRRPKVMTAIGRTHPTSGTRHTTNFSLKKKRHECSVLLFYKHESHLTTASVLQLALLPRFSLLLSKSMVNNIASCWLYDVAMSHIVKFIANKYNS